jgi:hypothetical protein
MPGDDGELALQQQPQRLLARRNRDDVLPELLQHDLVGQMLLAKIVDDQDVGTLDARHGAAIHAGSRLS